MLKLNENLLLLDAAFENFDVKKEFDALSINPVIFLEITDFLVFKTSS